MEQLVGLAILWLLMSLFAGARKRQQQQQQRRRPPPPLGGAGPKATSPDASQREGSFLEQMLQEMQIEARGSRSGSAGPMGRAAERPLPGAEEVEERAVLGGGRPAVSLEQAATSYRRPVVDLDLESAAAAERRVTEAEERNRALTLADHRAFDRKIRATRAAEPSSSAANDRARLRQAVVWREILGPPAALRDDPWS